MPKPPKGHLSKTLSSLTLSAGLCLAGTTALAQNQDNGATASAPATDRTTRETGNGLARDLEDYFGRGYRAHGNSENVWIAPPTRQEVNFLNPNGNGPFKDAYETLEVRPLKWAWAREGASGLEYRAVFGKTEILIKNTHWNLRSGVTLSFYQNLDSRGHNIRAGGGPVANTYQGAFIEASNRGSMMGMPVIGTLGTSFNHFSGDDWDRNGFFQTYSATLDFPRLIGKKQETGDTHLDDYAIGKISGMVRAEQSTDGFFVGRIGVYYNHLKSKDKVSYTVGPEVAFNNKGETSFRVRTRLSFR